jgi:catecholate siderophore receptor
MRQSGAGDLASRLLAGTALGLLAAFPARGQEVAATDGGQRPERVIIQGQRPEDYKIDVPSLSKLPEPLVDVPQSVDVISSQLLKDQAITDLNDALRAVPGISIGAGEFSWQGNNPTIRGFVARTDMFLDGIRDFGNYYRDPFNLQDIEVLEGPSSILFGRGSTGGVIEQTSKDPTLTGFVDATLIGGTDSTRRATVDIDEPLPDLAEGAAFRFNGMAHAQSVAGRNVAKNERFGLAPSLALGLGTPTRLTFSLFDQNADDVPDYGLPWYGTAPAPVPRQTFYGFDTDHLRTGVNVGTFRVDHDFGMGTIHNTMRYARYARDFRISEPIVTAPQGTPLSNIDVSFNIWSGNSIETMAWDQLEGSTNFDTGPVHQTLVAGIEGGRETSAPEFDNSSGVPTVPLLNADPHRLFNASSTYPRLIANTVAWSFAPYVIDTIKIGDHWEIDAGIRWDYFRSHYKATRYSTTTPGAIIGYDNVPRTDTAPSYRAALVYKPMMNGSIYFDYGTSFNPSAESLTQITSGRGLGISNADLAPEKNRSFELGTKWNVLNDGLALTAAIFRLEKTDARLPDPNNPGFNILAGAERVDGFQVGALGRLTPDWQISAGYTYLDASVTRSEPGAAPVGAPLPNTPKHSFSLFTEYRITRRFELGGGGNYVSMRLAQNVAPLKAVPGYWVFDAMAKYDITDKISLQLNLNNLFDKYYYDAIHPWHVVPGEGRVGLLTLNFNY